MGSEPVDKIKTSGMVDAMFLYSKDRSVFGLSMNMRPRFVETNWLTANTTWKGKYTKTFRVDHSPIRQTFKFENNFSTVGKSFLNLVKL